MKNTILKFSFIFLAAFTLVSCGGDDEPSVSTEYDGLYFGTVYSGSSQLGNYSLTITNGQVVGSYSDGFESISFNTTVAEGGFVSFSIDDGFGYVVTIDLTISPTGIVSGSWTDTDGFSGSIAGTGTHNSFDGSYSGSASIGSTVIGSFTISIAQGKITGVYTEDGEQTSINGFVTPTGTISFNMFFDDGTIASISGTVSGTTISGTFINNLGDSGTFSGTKN
ncbi:MAG: hypothetical protein RLN88_05110 [Ekhidna sp.]|uniref:hypothetical protein n=1 Tax=Ekhidna sp. TaxID=2608089 RepID=UPI0032EBFCFB